MLIEVMEVESMLKLSRPLTEQDKVLLKEFITCKFLLEFAESQGDEAQAAHYRMRLEQLSNHDTSN